MQIVTVLHLPFQFGYLYFSLLITVAETSNTTLNRIWVSRHPYLFPEFSKKAFQLFTLEYCLRVYMCINIYIMFDESKSESESHSVMSDLLPPHGLCSPWNSPGQNTGVDSHILLQGIFPIQRLNPGLSHCRWVLYQLSHQRSPRILEWVAYPFSSGSSQHRKHTRVSCTAGGFFTN